MLRKQDFTIGIEEEYLLVDPVSRDLAADPAEWELLADTTSGARNGFATPDAIAPRRLSLRAGSGFTVRLPARSVSVISFDAAR